MTTEELYGQDVKLGGNLQPIVTANGEMVLSSGTETVTQEVALRIFVYLGNLWYDTEFGSLAPDWILDENTEINRMSLVAELTSRIQKEPRLRPETVKCKVKKWDAEGIVLVCEFYLIDPEQNHPFNIVFNISSELNFVVQDVNPAHGV